MLSQAELKELFDYDPETGVLVWAVDRGSQKVKGKRVGHINQGGYLKTIVFGQNWIVHRLIYYRFHGELPKYIDHKNGIRTDNRIANLRSTTMAGNARNTRSRKSASSKYLGVSLVKKTGTWSAALKTGGRSYWLGTFTDENDAARAYNSAAIKYFGEFANLNTVPGGTDEKILH